MEAGRSRRWALRMSRTRWWACPWQSLARSSSAVAAAIFGFMVVLQFVPAALYEQYFQQSLLGYSMACIALAMLPVGILRTGLGRATPR